MRKLLTTRFRFHEQKRLCGQLASAALRQDLRLGALREELSAHDDGGVGEDALPSTLKMPYLETSITRGALTSALQYLAWVSASTRVQILSRLMVGQWNLLFCLWK